MCFCKWLLVTTCLKIQLKNWFFLKLAVICRYNAGLAFFYARIIHRSVLGGLTDRLKMTEEDLRKAHRVITKDHF